MRRLYEDFQSLTTFGDDIDLRALSFNAGEDARRIEVRDAGGGTLAVLTGAGRERTVTVVDGDDFDGFRFKKILAATDVAELWVFW